MQRVIVSKQRGFTLIELLVTCFIVAGVLGMAGFALAQCGAASADSTAGGGQRADQVKAYVRGLSFEPVGEVQCSNVLGAAFERCSVTARDPDRKVVILRLKCAKAISFGDGCTMLSQNGTDN